MNKGGVLKYLKYQVPAGILSMVLGLSLVIAMLCTSLISLAYFYRAASADVHIKDRLSRNAASGIQYLLAEAENFEKNEAIHVDLFQEEKDSVVLLQKPWGLFNIAVAVAHQGRHTSGKVAMTGFKPQGEATAALYLSDERGGLSIAGDTEIRGDAYLPKAGIKTTTINRMGYSGDQLVYGRVKESSSALPVLNQKLTDQLTLLLQSGPANGMDYFTTAINNLPDSLHHPFHNDYSLYYLSQSPIYLTGFISGNVIIRSAVELVLSESAYLENVILLAPKITVASGFKGRLQAFASDTIVIEENCHLSYPTVLAVLSEQEEALFEIKSGTRISGILWINGNDGDFNKKLLKIDEGSFINGQVYVNGMVAHQGQIWGNLTCRKFLLETPATIYENHLLNAVLDYTKLSEYFIGSALWSASNKKGIVQWLD